MEYNTSLAPQEKSEEQLFTQIKQMLDHARRHIAHTVNATTVEAYWQVGKYIGNMNKPEMRKLNMEKILSTDCPNG